MKYGISHMSRTLENRFFHEQNLKLSEQYRRLKEEEESLEALAKVSGIKNQEVLKELLAHKIRPETLAALCLVPIIEVAWADGTVDEKESSAILRGLESDGMGSDAIMVREWLRSKPDAKFMESWKTYMRGLAKELGNSFMHDLEKDIMAHAKSVAEASGNFLGLVNPVSPNEKAMLASIAAFFKELD